MVFASRTWSIRMHLVRTVALSTCVTTADWTAEDIRVDAIFVLGPLCPITIFERALKHRLISLKIATAELLIINTKGFGIGVLLYEVVRNCLTAMPRPTPNCRRRKLVFKRVLIKRKHLSIEVLLETDGTNEFVVCGMSAV